MKKVSILFAVTMMAVLALSLLNVNPVYSNSENGKVRVMVQFAPGKGADVEKGLLAAGGEIHYRFDDLQVFAVSLPAAALPGIQKNPNVVLVEEDAPRYPISIMPSKSVAADVIQSNGQIVPYGIDMVQARNVWDANTDGIVDAGAPTGAGIKVCVIDSGVYAGHEDLSGATLDGYVSSTLPWNVDGFGHGTHVTGTITAVNNALGVVGVLPGTGNIYMVRVFGDDGAWAYSSTLISAANICDSNGARIISMSLGGSKSSVTEKRGFDSLYSKGILSIAAAGNDGTSAYSYPASYDSVMSVAAIDSNKTVATFSQFNSQVEIAAPGVGVLSTLPYVDASSVTVDGIPYSAAHIEYSARGTATGALVDGGLCGSTGAWSGKVVLCERGTYDFYTKVMNVQNSGGLAALIYNNVPGGFLGTLGAGNSSTIVALSLSQEDGQDLVTKVGSDAAVSSTLTQPASGYEAWDGTSMATPHVSAVAALIWSAKTSATNVEIRNILDSTAHDLGATGRDVYYGYGLVQAKAALDALTGGGGGETGGTLHVADLTGLATTVNSKFWKATVTVTIKDSNLAPVSGAVVSGAWSGGYTKTGTCTTGTDGTCSISTANLKSTVPSVTFTVTDVAATGFTYDASANSETSITVNK